ncbi:aromatic acid exporter family protein [Melghirimyces algeriensis]|uniref:Uncharacterized membrane protein YgaE, UPF0421/DUF939 family n=1 Tax=Melghirimyces algeriensis TaxID=910412 RepID=A0A521EXD0_9BACL|nr:aromatic acid exporter family protein [Melghirimyces algeriensis]SMO88569.1 Uncharacterized membrane protein YgaE, UPF0421/DUF939 family [Melghirimyces algeriensis]
MRIGFRTTKTVIAVLCSIFIAEALGLKLSTFAGIVATLLIQTTRRETLVAAVKLLAASFITLVISTLLLYFLGFHLFVIGLILLIIIPILTSTRTQRGVVLSTVVCIHLYTAGSVQWEVLVNELALLFVGMTVAITINLIYMPNRKDALDHIQVQLEREMASFLDQLALALEGENEDWDGGEILRIGSWIQEGKQLAVIHEDNYITQDDMLDLTYFERKEKQFSHMKYMLVLVSRVETEVVQGKMIAGLLRRLAQSLRERQETASEALILETESLRERFEAMDLPATREEFETRSALLQILHELKALIRKEVW